MKKLLLILTAVMLLVISGCASAPASAVSAENTANKTVQAADTVKTDNARRVKLETGGKTAVLVLNDSQAAVRLYNMLPLTLSFRDFNNTEKISYTEKSLTDGLNPEGHQPQAGDLCVYAPWGNLCLFYRGFRHTDDLFYLGHLESGLELFATQSSDFEVRLTKAAE